MVHKINGINVDKCVNYRDEVILTECVKDACSIGLWQRHYQNLELNCLMSCRCSENPNCAYKQMKKQQKELNKYKKCIKAIKQNCKTILKYCNYYKTTKTYSGGQYTAAEEILQEINKVEK